MMLSAIDQRTSVLAKRKTKPERRVDGLGAATRSSVSAILSTIRNDFSKGKRRRRFHPKTEILHRGVTRCGTASTEILTADDTDEEGVKFECRNPKQNRITKLQEICRGAVSAAKSRQKTVSNFPRRTFRYGFELRASDFEFVPVVAALR